LFVSIRLLYVFAHSESLNFRADATTLVEGVFFWFNMADRTIDTAGGPTMKRWSVPYTMFGASVAVSWRVCE
jgi:hypothetical protein